MRCATLIIEIALALIESLMSPDIQKIISSLKLEPLPGEGGFFRQTYRTDATFKTSGELRPLATAIYFLITPTDFSALHRLKNDELYHFYAGDPIEQLLLFPDGHSKTRILGNNLLAGQEPQALIPANVWQGSRLLAGGQWALVGCTLSPGWIESDLCLANAPDLISQYPARSDLILALSRE